MTLFSESEQKFSQIISELSYCNPFLPRRIELVGEALGESYIETPQVWSMRSDSLEVDQNVEKLGKKTLDLATVIRERLVKNEQASQEELRWYEDLVVYVLYDRYRKKLSEVILNDDKATTGVEKLQLIPFWDDFCQEVDHHAKIGNFEFSVLSDPAHLLACFYQVRRAFYYIFHYIIGSSMPAAVLRGKIWQSIFTHDMRRFQTSLFRCMGDMATLVVGPSGTGKELVARAIGMSRYIPFDEKKKSFVEHHALSFYPLNLSALSPTLIESELFGHAKGTFTGAIDDHQGWFEKCPELGTVFLDEIGELDISIQVKLLRVLQSREFQRIGDTKTLNFYGKIIAATNRDMNEEVQSGKFREDFYYRLCSDVILAPSLVEQLSDSPEDLVEMVKYIVTRIIGHTDPTLAADIVQWIKCNLGQLYPWPGNFRELEQCVRNVMIRNQYTPLNISPASNRIPTPLETLAEEFTSAALTADQILSRYCTLVYAKKGSYEQAAILLKIDRRTVKNKIDEQLLAQLQQPKQ